METAETVDLKTGDYPNDLSFTAPINMDKLHVLNKSIKHIQIIILINIICFFLYCGRSTIWISYAETFENSNTTTIAFVIWIESTVTAIIGFLFCLFGQKYGYDKILTLLLLIVCMGSIIETIANNFVTLFIGYLISQLSFLIIYITVAYISWFLPFKYSITYISYNYALIIIFSLIGPFFIKLISSNFVFNSYKIAFIINTVIIFLAFIICLIFIFDKQKKIQSVQLEIEQQSRYQINNKNDNNQYVHHDRFPIIFYQKLNITKTIKCYNLSFGKDTFLEWYFFFHYIIQIGFIYGQTAIFYTYYLQFIIEKYDNNNITILQGSLHLFSSAISASVGIIFTRFILLKLSFIMERILVFVGLTICLGICGFAFIESQKMYFNFIWCSVFMFIIGSLLIQFEKLLLEIQTYPKESGKINGIKCIITNIIRSICTLLPALLWNSQIFHGLWLSMSIIITIMILSEMLYTLPSALQEHKMLLQKQEDQQELQETH